MVDRSAVSWGANRPVTDKFYHHYDEFYDVMKLAVVERMVEVGVFKGGSMAYWLDLMPGVEAHGCDVGDVRLFSDGWTFHQGDAYSEEWLATQQEWLATGFDFMVDDGSHLVEHQRFFISHWVANYLRPEGIAVVEDIRPPDVKKVAEAVPAGYVWAEMDFQEKSNDEWSRLLIIQKAGK